MEQGGQTRRAPFVGEVLGLRRRAASQKSPHAGEYLPNVSDAGDIASIEISRGMLHRLGLDSQPGPEGQAAGNILEQQVALHLMSFLTQHEQRRDGPYARDWEALSEGNPLEGFRQFEHLGHLRTMVEGDRQLRVLVATYRVQPDVTVGVRPAGSTGLRTLHASVSCKLTIRSDRVQNVRLESQVMVANRKGRLPHMVAVTAEPLPSRIASIAQGTGDLDAVYHIALDELLAAAEEYYADRQDKAQLEVLMDLIGADRLLPYGALPIALLD